MKPQPKSEAMLAIICAARSRATSTTEARRIVRACKSLGLDSNATIRVLCWLDYCDANTGEPWQPKRIKRVW